MLDEDDRTSRERPRCWMTMIWKMLYVYIDTKNAATSTALRVTLEFVAGPGRSRFTNGKVNSQTHASTIRQPLQLAAARGYRPCAGRGKRAAYLPYRPPASASYPSKTEYAYVWLCTVVEYRHKMPTIYIYSMTFSLSCDNEKY